MDAIVFYITALVSVVAAVLVVTRKNPVYSALFLVLFFTMVSVDFLILGAPFLAAIQVLLYAGAIMVLFLFVLMLLNLQPSELEETVSRRRKVLSGIASLLLFALLSFAIARSPTVQGFRGERGLVGPVVASSERTEDTAREVAASGDTAAVSRSLFTRHLLAFELTSVLIMVALIGAVYLTKTRNTRKLAPDEKVNT